MHLGFLLLGLLTGGTAAVAAFSHDFSFPVAVVAYGFFGMGAVFFAAVIWSLVPQPRLLPSRGKRPGLVMHPSSPPPLT